MFLILLAFVPVAFIAPKDWLKDIPSQHRRPKNITKEINLFACWLY